MLNFFTSTRTSKGLVFITKSISKNLLIQIGLYWEFYSLDCIILVTQIINLHNTNPYGDDDESNDSNFIVLIN